jgi:predicted nucleic acid-binding protein
VIYLDTSVIAPFYWQEALSDAVEQLLRTEEQPGISQLVEVELFSALSRRVRMGEISQPGAQAIAERFEAHLNDGFYTRMIVESHDYELARQWIRRFETPLRTLDALHLAIAAAYEVRLVTADQALVASAAVFGVEVQLLEPLIAS